jgi:hypothetical protein
MSRKFYRDSSDERSDMIRLRKWLDDPARPAAPLLFSGWTLDVALAAVDAMYLFASTSRPGNRASKTLPSGRPWPEDAT